MVSYLLTLKRFHTMFWCFYCWPWTSKCHKSRASITNNEMIFTHWDIQIGKYLLKVINMNTRLTYRRMLPGICSKLTRILNLQGTSSKLNKHKTVSSERLIFVQFTSHVQKEGHYLTLSDPHLTSFNLVYWDCANFQVSIKRPKYDVENDSHAKKKYRKVMNSIIHFRNSTLANWKNIPSWKNYFDCFYSGGLNL